MGPVRDVHGFPIWRIRVTRGELTCTQCGETTAEGYCYRCDDGKSHAGRGQWTRSGAATLVPTTSYLHPEEYEAP